MQVLYTNARLMTLEGEGLGLVDKGVLLTRGERIVYAGPADGISVPGGARIVDCGGRWISPGLVDCHTHIVHAGTRAREFGMRLEGAGYEEIARAGGGIISSVMQLRAASQEALLEQSLPRLDALIAEGLTTIEVKSGYGLTIPDELKMLRAARALGQKRRVRVVTSWLAAHATPPEYKGRNADYIREVALPGLEAAHAGGLADGVDAFCEGIAFSPEELRPLFQHARALGLPVRLHADQLSNLSGGAFAAGFGALSADHLEYADAATAAAMARAGTVAVILPGAFYFIRETQKPPIALFREHGTRMALATDNNPGSSPLTSLLLTMNMAATLFGMTVAECVAGVTREGARALGLLAETGTLSAGKRADLAIWSIGEPAELVCNIGLNPLHRRICGGVAD